MNRSNGTWISPMGLQAAILVSAATGIFSPPLDAQVPQTAATLDAVSIHPNTSGLRVSREPNSPGRLFENTTLSRLIQLAYGVQERNIIGPDSLSSDRYDVTATVAAPLTRTQMLPMLQSVLADRFALRLRCGSRRVDRNCSLPAPT